MLYDCIIVGGGLAGSLLFYGLKSTQPHKKILLLEKNAHLGGNHTWCFHGSDVSLTESPWLAKLISKSWHEYEVVFPLYRRIIPTAYHCIQSRKLHKVLINDFASAIRLLTDVTGVNKKEVLLTTGEKLTSHCVVDARGWRASENKAVGYQKFVGLDLKLKTPHHFPRVRLKDARVSQKDGYRFIYILPWSDDELLIEDTYYSRDPELSTEEIKERIFSYLSGEGLEVEAIVREECGSLPLSSSFSHFPEDAVLLGARSGQYHPVTGYTFPQTFARIDALLKVREFDTTLWKETLNSLDAMDRSQQSYFHFLNKLLFLGATPDKRYLILEHFYTLPQSLIENFYRGRLSTWEKIRVFSGKPPIPLKEFFKISFKEFF